MKRFILFAFVFALGCHGKNCTTGQKWSNGTCCNNDQYYNKSASSCQDCKCNEFGAKGGKKGGCDEKGDCYCYYDYTDGKCGSCVKGATRLQSGRCDGGCPSGQKRSNGRCCLMDYYYATWDNKCRYCGCNSDGGKGGKKGECDERGWCYCNKGYADAWCESCIDSYKKSNGHCCKKDEYYALWNNQCRYCKCNEFGAKGGKKGGCDEKGYCYCHHNYTDGECGSCVKGATRLDSGGCDGGCPSGQKRSNGHCCPLDHFYTTWPFECRYCSCNSNGAKGGKKGECDERGWCYCKEGYADPKCESCIAGYEKSNGHCCKKDEYYALWDNKCRYCRCNEFGAKGGKKGRCDEKGDCYCYYDYHDGECGSCVKGATRLKSGRCDDGCPSGQKRSNGRCCKLDHYYSTVYYQCRDCRCEEIGSKKDKKGECDESGQCYCKDDFTGYECQKCKGKDKKISNRQCCKKDHFYSLIDKRCKACGCHEFGAVGGKKGECGEQGWCNCVNGRHRGPDCDKCWSPYTMSNGRCCLKNQYYNINYKKCRDCRCEDIGTKGGKGSGCDQNGNCYCWLVYTGSECQDCKRGYIKSNGHCCLKDEYYSTWYVSCKPCKCSEHGSKGGKKGGCDGNGNCYCYDSHKGKKCNRCKNGAPYSRHCCKNDQYYAAWSSTKCHDCKCQYPGSRGDECDDDGYCYCKGNYYGQHCQNIDK